VNDSRRQNPLLATGLLLRTQDERVDFLGTCFAFRQPTRFLTAAHCIGNLTPRELAIAIPNITTDEPFRVQNVIRHPAADLAVLVLADDPVPPITPFRFYGGMGWGLEFRAFGFPEDVFGTSPAQPTARLFAGHIQRMMRHASKDGYEYDAAELSIGAPAGLSGGPLVRHDLPLIIGVVTENHRSTTFLQAVEEIQEGGSVYKETIREMITYGIALLLQPLDGFLSQHIPPEQP